MIVRDKRLLVAVLVGRLCWVSVLLRLLVVLPCYCPFMFGLWHVNEHYYRLGDFCRDWRDMLS